MDGPVHHDYAGSRRKNGNLRGRSAPHAPQRAEKRKDQNGDGRGHDTHAGRVRGQSAANGRQHRETRHGRESHAVRAGGIGETGPERADGSPRELGHVQQVA